MAQTSTKPDNDNLDAYGVERNHADEENALTKLRDKWPWFDHIMRMNDRYGEQGGNQFAAGITYFSVLSIFPLLMLVLATVAIVLASNQELLDQVLDQIRNLGSGEMGDTLAKIVDGAIDQRKSVFSIGLLMALWSGLSWMNHLRIGASEMWKVGVKPENAVKGKISDLLGLLGLLFALIVAFTITTIGNSGLTLTLLGYVGLDEVPGIRGITFGIALIVGVLANLLVFFWLMIYLPRAMVPRKSAFQAAIIGAIAFEVFKQFAAIFFSNALSNPAGAAFGPIIGIMVLFYFIWRITLYCCAWAATTPESLAMMTPPVPPAAVIRVRQEVRTGATEAGRAGLVGTGAALGVLVGGAITSLFKR